jgi:pimeloyl-ACP methyl ester carboxylesterase
VIAAAPASRLRAALLAVALAACAAPAPALAPASPAQAVRAAAAAARAAGRERFPIRFASPELAANVQGNLGEARAVVRLPPAAARCRAGAERCWLILFLPGFDASPEHAVELLAPRLAELERTGAAPPAVLVAVDGRTRLGGGFYVDSPASGRFETMLLDRLLPALRAELGLDLPPARTLVAGHSMGGFGALWLALARPGEFAGAAAFAPAARTVPLAEGLLAAVERAEAGRAGGVDPAAQVRDPDPQRFRERLLWALCAALLPAPGRPGGVALPFDPARRPWTLDEASAAGLARFDLGRPLEGGPAEGARALPRILVTGGGRDRLIPPADVEAVAAALSAARGPGREVRRVIRPEADHGSGLAEDFAEAVRYLTGGR